MDKWVARFAWVLAVACVCAGAAGVYFAMKPKECGAVFVDAVAEYGRPINVVAGDSFVVAIWADSHLVFAVPDSHNVGVAKRLGGQSRGECVTPGGETRVVLAVPGQPKGFLRAAPREDVQ